MRIQPLMDTTFPQKVGRENLMIKSKKALGVLAAAALGVVGVRGASASTIITQWAFGNSVVASPYNSPPPTTGSGTAVSLGMTNSYTYGGGEGPGSVTNDDIENAGGTINESTWRIRGNSNTKNSGAGLANGWNNSAPNYTQGAEFVESTAGYTNLNLSFDWYCTTQGVGNLQIQYTLDASNANPTWVNVGSDLIATPNDFYGEPSASEPNVSVSIPDAGGSDFAVQLVSVRPVPGDSDYSATGPGGDGNYAAAKGDTSSGYGYRLQQQLRQLEL